MSAARTLTLRGLLAAGVVVVVAANAAAENAAAYAGRRGLVTTSSCPYSCKDAGLSPNNCREWEFGESCEIEDFTQAPGHRSLIRTAGFAAPAGSGTQAKPPREWRDGNGTWLTVPSARALEVTPNSRGLVTTAACPYTCQTAGLEAKYCREWRDGETCSVEDLLQAPGHRSLLHR